jgi:hypothetical protein
LVNQAKLAKTQELLKDQMKENPHSRI